VRLTLPHLLFHPFDVFPRFCYWACTLFNLHFTYCPHCFSINVRQQQYADDIQLMLFISPSNIESSLITRQKLAVFTMALLSTQTRLQLSVLEPPTGDSLSAVSPPFKWLTPLSHLAITSNY